MSEPSAPCPAGMGRRQYLRCRQSWLRAGREACRQHVCDGGPRGGDWGCPRAVLPAPEIGAEDFRGCSIRPILKAVTFLLPVIHPTSHEHFPIDILRNTRELA